MAKAIEPVGSVGEFLLNAPLYETFLMDAQEKFLALLCGRNAGPSRMVKFDGYCPYCKRDTTFTLRPFTMSDAEWSQSANRTSFDGVNIWCARESWHSVQFFVHIVKDEIQKMGQYPSLADIAISEVRAKYQSVLKGKNWSELYKAIGLAAHGEGIGSFVYLRRVLERLVRSRFDAFKAEEGWHDGDFNGLRMDEKVQFLRSHLPSYLVESRRIYSIFSLGVHELDNEQCLAFFEIGKRSILLILQDDLVKQEELAARRQLADAIAKFDVTREEPPASDVNEDA